jgi:hypothetical protein
MRVHLLQALHAVMLGQNIYNNRKKGAEEEHGKRVTNEK